MTAFGTAAGRPLQGRGGSPGFRFTLYAVLAVVIMYLDQRARYLEHVRFLLQAAAYPVQLVVNSPPSAWRWIRESFQTRESLRAENERLRQRQRDLELMSMRYEALAHENGELRGLRDALPPVADRWLPAEIINIQLSGLRQRLLINRGVSNGVFKGQAVLDDRGLIGQTTHVGPWSAEVILITDPEHAVPVRVDRTGLRTIAVGGGDGSSLALPYLPANADIRKDDLLVTSGLGGVFPEGYPVARVAEVHRDAVQPLAQVRALALSHINSDTEVMLVWFRQGHPASPAASASSAAEVKSGNAAMQPLAAPPRASTAARAEAAAAGAAGAAAPPAADAPLRVPRPRRVPSPAPAPSAAATDDNPAAPQAPAPQPAAAPGESPPPADTPAEPPRPQS
ncbi:MAG TPA: rod shape-determining protein MreC [Steroidobacteraceae bacterium]|nr:rod shape-determining protein MreC [Steroidobacteraceae bacterium]